MRNFWIYGILPSVVVYIIACMMDFWAGVCTDRVLFLLIFNSALILPLCCLLTMVKNRTDIKKCFACALILPAVLPCAELCIYLYVLGFKITLEQIVFSEMLFILAAYIIILPGKVLVSYKNGNQVKKLLNCFLIVVVSVGTVFGGILIISADEWQVPYEKYELSGDFAPENEGYCLLQENPDGLIYEKKLYGGRTVYCKVYDNTERNSITVEKWGNGRDVK